MASTYSTRLDLTLQGIGENDDTWGSILNTVIQLVDDSIAGMVSISLASGSVVLTTTDGATNQARMAILELTGTITGNVTVTVPDVSKIYAVINKTSGAFTVTVKTAAGSGVTILQDNLTPFRPQFVVCDAVDVYAITAKTAESADTATTATDATNVTTTIGGNAIAGYARLAIANSWTAAQSSTPVALSDGANIATNAALGNVFTVTLGGSRTLDNPTNPVSGQTCTWRINTGAGSFTLAYGTAFEFAGNVAPTLTTTASRVDIITGNYDAVSTKWYCTISQNHYTS